MLGFSAIAETALAEVSAGIPILVPMRGRIIVNTLNHRRIVQNVLGRVRIMFNVRPPRPPTVRSS